MAPWTDSVHHLLSGWQALKIALSDRPLSDQDVLRSTLLSEITSYFSDYGDRIDVEDMVDFYASFFEDVFETCVDDGSLEKVNSIYIKEYEEVGDGGGRLQNGRVES